MNDDLKKMGYRLRPRVVETNGKQPGQVAFDERGNAVYEWNEDSLSEFGNNERAPLRALEYAGLAMVDDEPKENSPIQNNAKGLRLGYNPYESGLLPNKPVAKKRDLRELSKWIEAKRKVKTDNG